ncbi:MAG TPA: amylo-alpha-1,6-glucosidase [Candidatus Eisenbacteria bacterium]|jgi:predicted glycogen debranching enzyme
MIDLGYGRWQLGDLRRASSLEWLVTNGLGGFASGTVSGMLTRREHGLLVAAPSASHGATLLLAKVAERIQIDGAWVDLDTNRWVSGAVDPIGYVHLESFGLEDGIPTWTWAIGDTRLEKRVWMEHGENTTYVEYRLAGTRAGATLQARALVNHRCVSEPTGRVDWQAKVEPAAAGLRIQAFEGATPLWLTAPGAEVRPVHDWYRGFALPLETELGRPASEDHLWAAEFTFRLAPGDRATLVASTRREAGLGGPSGVAVAAARLRRLAHQRSLLGAWQAAQRAVARSAPDWVRRLVLAADAFLIGCATTEEPNGRGVNVGYPEIAEGGREALIALPGLSLATGRPEVARSVLARLARQVDQGLLPGADNRSGDTGYDGDASLWFFQAVRSYVDATEDDAFLERVYPVLEDIGAWIERGTRLGIGVDPRDGLLRVGEGEVPLTWMDARADGVAVTPRVGKPVEINALWYNALTAAARFARRLKRPSEAYEEMARRVANHFARFWNPEAGCLYDVLDGPRGPEAALRPNQILAVSLPDSPLPAARRRAVLEACGRWLLTSHGLRSLAPCDPGYRGTCMGEPRARAWARHQGTAWTWLSPHYALAHHRVHGDQVAALAVLEPLGRLVGALAAGFLPEAADGDPPHTPRGRVAGAAAVGETLRVYHQLARFGRGAGRVGARKPKAVEVQVEVGAEP